MTFIKHNKIQKLTIFINLPEVTHYYPLIVIDMYAFVYDMTLKYSFKSYTKKKDIKRKYN